MRKGSIYLQLSGNRKATSVYCLRCRKFHDTHRGLNPEVCPLDEDVVPQAPAFVPREKLGTMPRVKHWNVVKFGGLAPEEK